MSEPQTATDESLNESRLSAEFWQDKRLFASPDVISENPRRHGVAGWHSLEVIREAGPIGLSYAEWQARRRTDIRNTSGTQHHHLRWDYDRDNIRLAIDHGRDTPSPFSDVESDIRAVVHDPSLSETTRNALIKARRGQGRFRQGLVNRWDAACAVTGCKQVELLRASHMKPWSVSTNDERLNPDNGLLLSANIDALFDRGLVSFDADGSMLTSDLLHKETVELLNLPIALRGSLSTSELRFLAHHRSMWFR